jgi:hypothetical protein
MCVCVCVCVGGGGGGRGAQHQSCDRVRWATHLHNEPERVATGDDGCLVYRHSPLGEHGTQCVPPLVVSGDLEVLLGDARSTTLGAHHDLVLHV